MSLIRPKFHHINLSTTRLQDMIAWYGRVVGLEPIFQFPGGAWLSNDQANHRLALLVMPGVSDDPHKRLHTGIHHHAYEYATLAELLQTYTRLKAQGILPELTLDHGMTLSFYYPDPDGNLLELQVDNFGDWAASTQWMTTSPEFAANPIGVQFDPDKLVEAMAQGLSHREIQRKTYSGEFLPEKPRDLGV
jgi:catechol-2,3-dioxygenase